MDLRAQIADTLRPLWAQCSYIAGDDYDQGRQDTLTATEAALGEWADTVAAVVEQQRQRIKELKGALASAEDFCTRPNACGALMDAALERARENGDEK